MSARGRILGAWVSY